MTRLLPKKEDRKTFKMQCFPLYSILKAFGNLKMDFFKSVQRGKIKKVKKILEIGTIATNTNVIVNYKNPSDGSSPLHKATRNGTK